VESMRLGERGDNQLTACNFCAYHVLCFFTLFRMAAQWFRMAPSVLPARIFQVLTTMNPQTRPPLGARVEATVSKAHKARHHHCVHALGVVCKVPVQSSEGNVYVVVCSSLVHLNVFSGFSCHVLLPSPCCRKKPRESGQLQHGDKA
jgi:hypothetical protein